MPTDPIAAVEARASVILEHLTSVVSLVDSRGRILRQSGGGAISGHDPAGRIGHPIFEFAHPDDLGRALEWLARLDLTPAARIADLELRQRHGDGRWRHVRVRGSNLKANPAVGALLLEEQDETERHAEHDAATQLRDRLQLVAQAVRVGFFDYDVTTNRFEFTAECYTMRGLLPGAMHGVAGTDALKELHPDDRAAGRAALEAAIRGTTDEWDAEYRLPAAGGESMWVQQRGHVLARDGAGRATRIAGLLLDIDRRKRAERGLAHSEARYRTVVAMTPGFVHESIRDPHGRMLMRWASEGLTRLLGWTVDELNERGGWATIVHPDYRGPAADRKGRAFGGEPVRGETRLRAKSGEWRWFDASLFPLEDPETGRVASTLGMLYDISARKQTEERLRVSEERFRLAAVAVQGVIYERDVATGIVTASSGVEMLGYGSDSLRQPVEWWLDRIHPDDGRQMLADRVALGASRTLTFEYRLRHADGHYVDVVDRAIVVCDETGTPVRVVGCAIDVSQVRRAERLLREAETLAHVGSWQLDVATGELTFTAEGNRIVGAEPGPGRGDLESLLRYIAPSSAEPLRAAIERALATGEGYDVDIEIVRRDGVHRWLRTSGRAEVSDGRTVRLYGAFQDIDDIKRAEIRLREQGDRLRLALDAGELAAWRWNPRDDRMVVEHRPVGFDPDITFEPTLTEDLQTIAPEDRARVAAAMQRVIETGEPREFELAAFDAHGRRRWLRTRTVRAETPEGPVVVGTSREVTARRQADDALRASEAMLRSIADSSPDFIAIVDRELRIRFVNRGVGGEAPGEIVGRPVVSYAVNPVEFESRLRAVLASGRALRFESRAPREDGSDGIYEHRVGPVREAGRITGIVVYSTDITERRALEREILEISNREQRRIGSDLHDGLGQELTGIALMLGGLSSAVRRGASPKAAELRELTTLVRGAIEQTRTLARGLSPVALDGGGLVQALRALAARTREMYGLDIRFRSRVRPRVALDAAATGHLYRIAQESLTNAARHSGARTVLVQLNVTGRRVALAVSDDGRGFAPATTSGVGLKIMRYRAHMLDGELLIGPRSNGLGTRVTCIVTQPDPSAGEDAERRHA